ACTKWSSRPEKSARSASATWRSTPSRGCCSWWRASRPQCSPDDWRSALPTAPPPPWESDPNAGPDPSAESAADGDNPAAVHFDQVVKQFGSNVVLNHLDFTVDPGERVTLIGP